MNLYIENLADAIDNEKLKNIFSTYGDVVSAEVVKDVFTGASRGFGYVEMDDTAAQEAVQQLDQTTLNDLTVTVKEAPPKQVNRGSYKVGNTVNVYRFKKS